MRLGVVFPQIEIGADPGGVRAYAEAVEDLGYDHMLVFDHILGADPERHAPWTGAYTKDSLFHEPFVLFGFLAALTKRIEFATSVLILSQRQTALVAKQAAEVDILTGGRLRLGVGIGWNSVEYEALNEDWRTRGARSEEQVQLMRALWTQEVVNFNGRFHKIQAAGINPLPIQRPIPIWFGGHADKVMQRIARIGDGFILSSNDPPNERRAALVQRLMGYVKQAGRSPAEIGLDARANFRDGLDQAILEANKWAELGATHISLNTMNAGLNTPEQHIQAIRLFKEAFG